MCIWRIKRRKNNRKGHTCKMAGGEMVRYLAENNISTLDGLKSFNKLGYKYSEEESNNDTLYIYKIHIIK